MAKAAKSVKFSLFIQKQQSSINPAEEGLRKSKYTQIYLGLVKK